MQPIKRLFLALTVLILAFALFSLWRSRSDGYGLLNLLRGEKPASSSYTPPETPKLNLDDIALLTRLDNEYAKLAETVLPSVVSVNTKTVRRGSYGWHPFFGLVGRQAQVIPGLGSGAIISKEGHVVTNYHVIEGVTEVIVTTQDNNSYQAKVLGASKQRDIAVLRIQSQRRDFPALTFADSNEVRVGQLVLAVGNPFGLSGTVTRGIISARDRHLSDATLDYLQTDAVINPGNSGGPLVNVRGEILGINVAIYRGDENVRAWQGVGLAVPAKQAQAVINEVLKREQSRLPAAATTKPPELAPGYLGIKLAPEPVRLDRQLDSAANGAMVNAVDPGSPAEVSGLQSGDIIVEFNGESFDTPVDLLNLIQSQGAGQPVTIHILRNGELKELRTSLQSRPSTE